MKLLCVGGGSGGHVTPVLAVINELAKLDSNLEVTFVCDDAFFEQAKGLMSQAQVPVSVIKISAGKFRRYHDTPAHVQLLDISTVGKNFIDIFKTKWGFLQSLVIISRFKPDVVFAKGGYVCLPVGCAARLLGKPLVIHDSDARPGLTNRLLSRFATQIATGSPLENYPYRRDISHYTGVPISADFRPFTAEEMRELKHEIGVFPDRPLVVVTGGGLGATSINNAVQGDIEVMLGQGITVYHVCGKNNYDKMKRKAVDDENYILVPFVFKDMHKLLGAADVVVSRGSATFLQELAALKKAVIIIPAKQLGDQVKNALVYEKADAAVVLGDDEIGEKGRLAKEVIGLVSDHQRAVSLAERMNGFARPRAAFDTAQLIFKAKKG